DKDGSVPQSIIAACFFSLRSLFIASACSAFFRCSASCFCFSAASSASYWVNLATSCLSSSHFSSTNHVNSITGLPRALFVALMITQTPPSRRPDLVFFLHHSTPASRPLSRSASTKLLSLKECQSSTVSETPVKFSQLFFTLWSDCEQFG